MAGKSVHFRSVVNPNMAVCRRFHARLMTDRLVKVTCGHCLNNVSLSDVDARLVPVPEIQDAHDPPREMPLH